MLTPCKSGLVSQGYKGLPASVVRATLAGPRVGGIMSEESWEPERKSLKERFKDFWNGPESVIDYFDDVKVADVGGKELTWGFKIQRFQIFVLAVAVGSFFMWMWYGYDSTMHYFFKDIPLLATFFGYTVHEGAGMHWSTINLYAVQWFLMSYWLSRYKSIGGTRNFFFSTMAMFATGGFFEIIWMSLYDILHFQDFALWAFGDGNVFWRNITWIACLPLSYLVISVGTPYKPKFRVDKMFYGLIVLALVGWFFWIFYWSFFPWLTPIVFKGSGNVGTVLFPQTVYTCKDVLSSTKSLEAVYIPNFGVRMTNIIVKYLSALPFIYFFKINVWYKVDTMEIVP